MNTVGVKTIKVEIIDPQIEVRERKEEAKRAKAEKKKQKKAEAKKRKKENEKKRK